MSAVNRACASPKQLTATSSGGGQRKASPTRPSSGPEGQPIAPSASHGSPSSLSAATQPNSGGASLISTSTPPSGLIRYHSKPEASTGPPRTIATSPLCRRGSSCSESAETSGFVRTRRSSVATWTNASAGNPPGADGGGGDTAAGEAVARLGDGAAVLRSARVVGSAEP